MIVVWFSCGVASAVAAKVTLEKYKNVRVVNCPVIEEDSDNSRFRMDVEAWLGVSIESAINRRWPNCSAVEVWERGKFMSNVYGADCTRQLKKGARQQWVKEHNPAWHVLGFTADEEKRFKRFKESECENTLPVLIDAKITKAQCFDIVRDAGIKRPRIYDQGYPNANCIGCVKATSPTYWNLVREKHPEVFAARATLSREIGCRLTRVKGKRIFLDELKATDKGRALKSMNFDCGVFCEEAK
jgi:hypothetical protein